MEPLRSCERALGGQVTDCECGGWAVCCHGTLLEGWVRGVGEVGEGKGGRGMRVRIWNVWSGRRRKGGEEGVGEGWIVGRGSGGTEWMVWDWLGGGFLIVVVIRWS